MASVIWFCGNRSGNFLGLKNSLHYWILVLSHKQIVLLTLLTKLWEKYLDVNVAIDVLEKQVSENTGASFFFFFLFFCTCPFRKVVQSPRRSYRRLWKLGKRIMTTLIVYANESCDEHAVYFWGWRKWHTQLITFWLFGNDVIFPRI